MPVSIRIEGLDDIKSLKAFTDPENFRKAARAGMKYAADSGKVTAAKEIGSAFNLAASRIKADISKPFIRGDGAEAEIRFGRKPPTATTYGFADRGKGATGSFVRGRRVTLARSFQKQGGKGAGLIFRRLTQARTPIEPVFGASVGSIALGRGKFSDRIQKETTKRVQEQWFKGMERALAAAARRK